MDNGKDRRTSGIGESTITVKWWGVLLVIIAAFGYFFSVGLAHESRLTKLETAFEVRLASIDEALCDLKISFDKHTELGNR